MLITKRRHPSRLFTVLLIACLALVGAAPAIAADVPAQETPTLRSRLESFTHRAADLAMSAVSMLGIRYKMGGTDPDSGLDCSGLVRYVFKEAWDKDLPRTSAEISRAGKPIDKKDLQPGDLVFFNTMRRSFSHVGIYLGDSKFIHSPAAGGEVRIESIEVGYWKKRFNGARRIEESGTAQ